MKDFLTSPESSGALRCQGRPNVVSATSVLTSFETNGRGQMCLGQLCDPTLVATDLHGPHSVAHPVPASTTLKTDVGVVGLGHGQPACDAYRQKKQCKEGTRPQLSRRSRACLAHTIVNPVTQIIHQAYHTSQLSIQGVSTRYWSHTSC